MKTLKKEEINGRAFADIRDARRRINGFIAEVCNRITVTVHLTASAQNLAGGCDHQAGDDPR